MVGMAYHWLTIRLFAGKAQLVTEPGERADIGLRKSE
jgi:hypothetical protein